MGHIDAHAVVAAPPDKVYAYLADPRNAPTYIGAIKRVTSGPAGAGQVGDRYGAAAELSLGKDTPSGHWEMMGLPVDYDWGYFPATVPTFPKELIDAFIAETGVPGILGDCHASGTVIIDRSVSPAGFTLDWVETGGPVVSPPSRRGVGSQWIERGLGHALGGQSKIAFDASGVRFRLDAHLSDRLALA